MSIVYNKDKLVEAVNKIVFAFPDIRNCILIKGFIPNQGIAIIVPEALFNELCKSEQIVKRSDYIACIVIDGVHIQLRTDDKYIGYTRNKIDDIINDQRIIYGK